MVAVFPNVCLWRRSYSQNWEVLTFICQYGLRYCIVSPSFLFYCFVKNWATWENFLGKWFTAPLAKNCPYAYAWEHTTEHIAAKTFFPVTSSNVSDSRFFSCTEFCEKLLGVS